MKRTQREPRRRPRLVAMTWLLSALALACGEGPAATEPPPPIGGSAQEVAAVHDATTDVLERVLPVLGASGEAAALRPPLTALAAAVSARDRAAATRQLAAARAALVTFRNQHDADGSRSADLDALAVALLQVDWLLALPAHQP